MVIRFSSTYHQISDDNYVWEQITKLTVKGRLEKPYLPLCALKQL